MNAVETTLETVTSQASASPSWAAVEDVLRKHHHQPDLDAARALCGAVAAHNLPGAPVWPMLVAPPGSMKTHLLDSFDGLKGVHLIDRVTPQTFISGQIDDGRNSSSEPASLLLRIGAQGIIIYPDFSTVLSMKHDDKASVLADMRRIYDGRLRKEFGTSEKLSEREWKGRITFVVAVTPEIDQHYSVFQTLGERFVMIRWPRAGGIEAAVRAIDQDTKTAKDELKHAIHSLFDGLVSAEPELPETLKYRIAALSEIAVRGRTHVPRSGYNKEIIYVPEPESATRLAQQLAQLAKGLALLRGKTSVEDEDLRIVRRVAFDCIPPTRRKIIEALDAGAKLAGLGIPLSTLRYAKEDLTSQGLLEEDKLSDLALALIATERGQV